MQARMEPTHESEKTTHRGRSLVRAKKPVRVPDSAATRVWSAGRSLHIGGANVQASRSNSRDLQVPLRNHVPNIPETSCGCRTLTRMELDLASSPQKHPYFRQGSEFPCEAAHSRWRPLEGHLAPLDH